MSEPRLSKKDDKHSPLLVRPNSDYSSISPSHISTEAMSEPSVAPNAPPSSQSNPGEMSSAAPDQKGTGQPPSPPAAPPPPPGAGGVGLGPGGGLAAKADSSSSWAAPEGRHIRKRNDENLVIFRQAVGINGTLAASDSPASVEEGRRGAAGIYAAASDEVRRKGRLYRLVSLLIYAGHVAQIVVGASLTALGPSAGDHVIAITLLGAFNTVVAGLLALVKGQGLPDRLYNDRAEFQRLRDWIEQTEALLAVGVIGRDRKEVGGLVQTAFRKYNDAKRCEENNMPENYVRPRENSPPGTPGGSGGSPSLAGSREGSSSTLH